MSLIERLKLESELKSTVSIVPTYNTNINVVLLLLVCSIYLDLE